MLRYILILFDIRALAQAGMLAIAAFDRLRSGLRRSTITVRAHPCGGGHRGVT